MRSFFIRLFILSGLFFSALASAATSSLTGLWWNPSESGWGMSLTQQGTTVFVAWYTYDSNGKPAWFVMSSCPLAGSSCTGDIYSVKGGTPLELPWNGNGKAVTKAGTGTLAFTDNDTGTFNYSVNGASGTKQISRQMFATGTSQPATDYSALWWNESESGWGVALTQQYETIFATLYSYDASGNPVWYVASSCPLSGNGCTGDLYQVSGGAAPTVAWSANLAVTKVGTVSFALNDSCTGTMTYTINGVTTTKAITNQLPAANQCAASTVAAKTTAGVCAATLSQDLTLQVPQLYISGSPYSATLKITQSADGSYMAKTTSFEATSRTDCSDGDAGIIVLSNNTYVLHVPSIVFGSSQHWVNFEYIPAPGETISLANAAASVSGAGSTLKVTKYGNAATGDFPVNEPYAAALIGKGIPEPFARFFAAAKWVANCPGGTTCTYSITYPSGATRNVTWTATPNQQYTPTAGELASMALINENEPVYDGKFSAIGMEDTTKDAQINIDFFVPIANISIGPSSMGQKLPLTRRAAPSNALCCGVGGYQGGGYEGVRINMAEIGKKGADVAVGGALEIAKHVGDALGANGVARWGDGLGNIYKVAGVLNDAADVMKIHQETKAWLDELAALEECAKNPTNSLTQTDPNYSASTVAKLQEARARIIEQGVVRTLNVVDQIAEGFAMEGAASLLTIPMKQGHEYVEQTQKALSEQEMQWARDSVVSCVPTCPTNLVAAGVSESQIDLSWSGSLASASTAVTGYKVRRDGAYTNTTYSTAYSDTGLKPSTTYCYMVLAFNDYGVSPNCTQACAQTKGPPIVYATNPVNNATNVAVSSKITATFSEAMDAATISTGTFTISGVAGTVTYSGLTATFTPSADLEPSKTYTATITTGVKDLDGSAMEANYTWSFTTGGNIDGNLQFVLTADDGSGGSIRGSADVTWYLRDSNAAMTRYWGPTGTITAVIAHKDCDPVHVTKPISPITHGALAGVDTGGGLNIYSSMQNIFPQNTYIFWVNTDYWSQTFYCAQGTERAYKSVHEEYILLLGIKCMPEDSSSNAVAIEDTVFIPYTDAARLTDTFSCASFSLGDMSGRLDITWDFKNLK